MVFVADQIHCPWTEPAARCGRTVSWSILQFADSAHCVKREDEVRGEKNPINKTGEWRRKK